MERCSASIYPSADQAKPAILLVDADADFREALAENLREDGWIVHAYDRLPGGSELARLPAVDVLVTDPSDPCHGGLGFAESWHRIYPHVPVLVVTTDLARAWDVWANCRGGVEVRRKPIDYGRIRAALQALCPRLSPA